MSKKSKALLYNFICFATLFLVTYYLIVQYASLNISGLFRPFTAFIISTLIAPKFQAATTKDGEKLFMKWIFMKGVSEVK
jgi:hypothetical protein